MMKATTRGDSIQRASHSRHAALGQAVDHLLFGRHGNLTGLSIRRSGKGEAAFASVGATRLLFRGRGPPARDRLVNIGRMPMPLSPHIFTG